MTPADYLRFIVLPTLAEMLAEPADQRRAYLACITAAHLVDHVDVAKGSPPEGKWQVRKDVRAVGILVAGALEIVEAVATGAKHAKPDPKPNRAVKFPPGGERSVPAFTWGTPGAGWGEGRLGGAGLLVDMAGRRWFLDDAVRITVQSFVLAFPDRFAGVDLGSVAAGIDRLGTPTASPAEPPA